MHATGCSVCGGPDGHHAGGGGPGVGTITIYRPSTLLTRWTRRSPRSAQPPDEVDRIVCSDTEKILGIRRLGPRSASSGRTGSVHYALRTLHELGLITPADPEIVAAYIKRADRRPNGWDLALTTSHGIAAAPPAGVVNRAGDGRGGGVQPVHPGRVDGVQALSDGVQTAMSRGARTAPEPSQNHPGTVARARPRAAVRADRQPAPPGLAPICGRCDARPGDPASARIVWLGTDRQRSKPCPRCHPTAAADRPTPELQVPTQPTSSDTIPWAGIDAPAHAATHRRGLS
jgi:hypothetical protein